ncbi:unnamed protein product [Durusdinium trenchii]|uniref:Uncharacterized protein n=2 Tax=Durusdinium trenchii TaxID=1381693 RepID=A0ABP0R440_9DINO
MMLSTEEVMCINFSAARGSDETRLLRSKVCQMITTALEAMHEATCKTLRRRVGQRLRRKLGRILKQEEFEQALAIYKRYEDNLDDLPEDAQESESKEATPPSSTPASTTPPLTSPTNPFCIALPVIAMPVPVYVHVPVPVLEQVTVEKIVDVPVTNPVDVPSFPQASPARGALDARLMPLEPVEPATSPAATPPAGEAFRNYPKYGRMMERQSTCTGTTSLTGGSSVMDDEDYLDTQIEWMRSVTDGAPVERTFIQFNTNLKVARRSRSR